MVYGIYGSGEIEALVNSLESAASGILVGTNPTYATTDFAVYYPQFATVVPVPVLQAYIDLASVCVQQARYHDAWSYMMALFVAHFCTLYLRSTAPNGATAAQVLAAGEAHGLKTTKSVGDLSVGIDYEAVGRDLNGWASWKETEYGRQYAALAAAHTTGTMVV